MSAKSEYLLLLNKGELLELYPGFSGEWLLDKKLFEQLYEANLKAILEIDVTFELEDE